MPSQVETRKNALEATESLLGYPDAEVKSTARVVADYLKGLPVGLDEFLRAVTLEGSILTKLELQLTGFAASGRVYEFRRPIRVAVARSAHYFVASSNAFLVHGTEKTVQEALQDYIDEWQRHYQRLVAEEDHLGPPLQKELTGIRHLLAKERDAS